MLLFLLLCPAYCLAYTITEEELTILEQNLSELSTITTMSEQELKTVSLELQASQKELAAAKKELIKLQSQLTELEAINERQAVSLTKVNQSLQEYADEAKRKQRLLRWQRNAAWACVLVAVVIAIK